MEKMRKRLVIAAALLVCSGAVIAAVRLVQGEGKFLYTAKFTEFFACEGSDPDTGLPREATASVPLAGEGVYACGFLEADGKVPLYFLLFYEGQPTGWFDPVETYTTGWLYKELPSSWRKVGNYRVEVRLQRHLLAAAEFAIVP